MRNLVDKATTIAAETNHAVDLEEIDEIRKAAGLPVIGF